MKKTNFQQKTFQFNLEMVIKMKTTRVNSLMLGHLNLL